MAVLQQRCNQLHSEVSVVYSCTEVQHKYIYYAQPSEDASTSEQRTGVSTGQRQTSSKIKRVYSDADDELRDYCQRTLHIPTVNNPLEWWAENAHRVPRLAKLSRSYLAIPATGTPSERVFSLAGNTVTRKRSSLLPSHVDALVFLNANQKSGKVDVIVEDSE
ncbi:hypothetical protein KUCAC02_024178 [Chaenocephalus aceratus]|uniref:Uncharacterized protein n=1 Tax=Chaenocephalus aceratus TaxID=36190 RepID=A0ACB9WIW3_CHAAC|nr:hypothetical protein KUCAC02_024178 [Chaenocephalus aceratus]